MNDRPTGMVTQPRFGIAPATVSKLLGLFDSCAGIDAVWIFGSRARGTERVESDIDLAVDAPALTALQFSALKRRIEELELLYRTDVVWLQQVGDATFRQQIERHRQLFWEPRRPR